MLDENKPLQKTIQKYFGLFLNYTASFCSGRSSKQKNIWHGKILFHSNIKKVYYARISKIPLYSDHLAFSHVHSDQFQNFLIK